MIKRHFKLIITVILAVTLTLVLSGCGNDGQSLDGLNIVTFELDGGTLELKTSSVNTKINYAYEPGTYILDPTEIPGYKLYKQGYNFTGWYTGADCKPTEKWNFKTPFETESLTLYAGWEKAVKHTFTVYYVDGDEAVALGSYEVKGGDVFNDYRNHAGKRADYTPMGYYSDMSLTTPWDASFTHPGGEIDNNVAVYVDYIEGIWTLVKDAATFKSAIKAGESIYLMADIDLEGATLSTARSYNKTLEGNGYTVSNFKVEKTGGNKPIISIFRILDRDAVIRNVSFAGVEYDLTGLAETVETVEASAIANSTLGAKITNVTVSGTLTTNFAGEITTINSAVFKAEGDSQPTITDFTATITVEKQN